MGRLSARIRWAAALSFVAGGVHAGVTPEHFREWWGYGLFFVFASAAQILLGLALVTDAVTEAGFGPSWKKIRRTLWLVGAAGNVAILVLWLVTRTVGIPWLGPEAGTVEAIAPIDLLAVACEAATAALLVTEAMA
ncbi:MAG: hypothetical protein ACYDBQ_10075 [Thermoplasmatota archaeon]